MKTYLTLSTVALVLGAVAAPADQKDAVTLQKLREKVSVYASFDEAVRADFGGGELTFSTRTNHPTKKGEFVVKKGFDERAFAIAKDKGISGAALDASDVLDDNGRIFLPAKGNIAFKRGGWGGAVSMWVNTNPNELLKTKFCDPVQITQKGANNGGIWFDFNDAKPRDLRMGVFPAVPKGKKGASESDENAPMVRVPRVLFKQGMWHHVAITWENFDTGKADAVATLYINAKKIGQVKDRAIAMDWEIEKAGIYVAVNYIGLIDEFAVFKQPLTTAEITLLHGQPGVLSALKKK
jgi:hypothetical protein